MSKSTLWTFAGYITEAGSRIVQDWYDSLPENEFEELQDTLNYLADIEIWKRPEFDKVESPLHEIRSKANVANHQIRLYGVFHPEERRCFLFLHGVTAKKKWNDAKGQNVALARLKLLEQGKAKVHEFAIEEKSVEPDQEGKGRKSPAREFKPRKGDRLPDSRNKR